MHVAHPAFPSRTRSSSLCDVGLREPTTSGTTCPPQYTSGLGYKPHTWTHGTKEGPSGDDTRGEQARKCAPHPTPGPAYQECRGGVGCHGGGGAGTRLGGAGLPSPIIPLQGSRAARVLRCRAQVHWAGASPTSGPLSAPWCKKPSTQNQPPQPLVHAFSQKPTLRPSGRYLCAWPWPWLWAGRGPTSGCHEPEVLVLGKVQGSGHCPDGHGPARRPSLSLCLPGTDLRRF